jgi:sulfotransferase family protein
MWCRMTMRKPNFFILGAPKCGTTSIASWLGGHPNVFISAVKEPHFFNTDDRQGISTLRAYENLFSAANHNHYAVGEASVWYLFSTEAVKNILQYQPGARFIVMVRNPIEMAPALHAEMMISGHENIRDFAAAWEHQERRRQGQWLPPFSWAHRRFLYGDVCKLGSQIERLLSAVPASRVLAIVLDEIISDPRQQYLRVLRFLQLEDDERSDFPIYNKARTMRYPNLTRAAFDLTQIKRRIGIKPGINLWRRVSKFNTIEAPRARLSPKMEFTLRDYFEGDIQLLGGLLGRNFEHWLKSP